MYIEYVISRLCTVKIFSKHFTFNTYFGLKLIVEPLVNKFSKFKSLHLPENQIQSVSLIEKLFCILIYNNQDQEQPYVRLSAHYSVKLIDFTP